MYKNIDNSTSGITKNDLPKSIQNSSCPCSDCDDCKPYIRFDSTRTLDRGNLALHDEDFSCSNYVYHARSRNPQPYQEANYIVLNEPGIKPSSDFFRSENGYTKSYDSRLIDPRRNLTTILDVPPLESYTCDSHMYDENNYGKPYTTYSDIQTGQYRYYVDQSDANPYINPLFTIASDVEHVIFKDPMDSVKPMYVRTPLTKTNKYISDDQMTRDTIGFREDIMERQMAKYNQTRWDSRWLG
jgi:hypothetical protein